MCGKELLERGISRKGLCSDECEIISAVRKNENNCWIWTRDALNTGYGYISEGKKKHLAHRRSYEIFIGSIPQGKVIRHKCNIPACINPDHLEIGDQSDNVHDAQKLGNIKRKLNWSQVCEIRERYKNGENICDIYKKYDVVYKTIQDILLFKKWKKDPGF
jgi:HNH endonuclease